MTGPQHATGVREWLRAVRLLTCTCLAVLLVAGPAMAAPHHYPRLMIAQRDHSANGGISLDQAVAQARQRNNGKVLSAETIRVNGRKVHRIKILTKDGRVKRTQIDAGTGQGSSRGH